MKRHIALLLLFTAGITSRAEDIYLSSGVRDVVKLSKSTIDPKVIESFVQNSSIAYNPTADEIIYLHKEGVNDSVIAALLKRGGEIRQASPAAMPAPQAAASNPAPVTYQNAPAPTPIAPSYAYNSVIASPAAYYGSVISVPSYSYYPGYSYSCVSPVLSIGFGFPYGYRGYSGYSDYRGYGYGYSRAWAGGYGHNHVTFVGGTHGGRSSWSPAVVHAGHGGRR